MVVAKLGVVQLPVVVDARSVAPVEDEYQLKPVALAVPVIAKLTAPGPQFSPSVTLTILALHEGITVNK